MSRRACASSPTGSPMRRCWRAPASSGSAWESRITAPVPTQEMLPAVAQGAIGIEIRADDEATAQLLAPINHQPTALAVAVERAFLAKLDGSCRTPIAGLAELASPDRLVFRGMILTPDGRQCHATAPRRPPRDRHRHGARTPPPSCWPRRARIFSARLPDAPPRHPPGARCAQVESGAGGARPSGDGGAVARRVVRGWRTSSTSTACRR